MTSSSFAAGQGARSLPLEEGRYRPVIDALGPDGVAARVVDVTNRVVRLQTGYLYHYAFAMLHRRCRPRYLDDAREFTSDDRLAYSFSGHVSCRWLAFFSCCSCGMMDPTAAATSCNVSLADHGLHLRRLAVRVDWLRHRQCRLPDDREAPTGSAPASAITWASTAFPCCSSSSTTFLMPLLRAGELASRSRSAVKDYMIAFLVLETLMIGVFTSLDIVLFYVFFEAGLIPMFLIIGVWGGKRSRLRQLQVLPLYPARLGADAARHHGDVLAGRHDGYPDAACATSSRRRCRHGYGWLSSPPSR